MNDDGMGSDKIEFRKKLGKIVENFRIAKGMSRKQLGEALGYQGNSAQQTVFRFESGRAGIPKLKIAELLEVLGINPKDFGFDAKKTLINWIASSGILSSRFHDKPIQIYEGQGENNSNEELDSIVSHEENQTSFDDVMKLLKIYRTKKKGNSSLTTIEKINLINDLSNGDNNIMTKIMELMNISPQEAYKALESDLIQQLSIAKQTSSF